MPHNTLDRRVQKTRKLLQDALIELVAEEGYESVTIQEILDKANVGRSTFYAHFQDKDQLLRSILDRLDELFEEHKTRLTATLKSSKKASENDSLIGLSPTLNIFQFVGQNHHFFKALLRNRGYGIFAKPVYDYLYGHIHGIFTRPAHSDALDHLHRPFKMQGVQKYSSLESEVAAHYFVSALMGILIWWVENGMLCTAEEIDGLFRRLAMPSFGYELAVNHKTT